MPKATYEFSNYASESAQEEAEDLVNRCFPWRPGPLPPKPKALSYHCTLAEVAVVLGCARENCRRIERHAAHFLKKVVAHYIE